MPRVVPITGQSNVRVALHAWVLVPCLLALSVASASAQDKSP